MKKISLILCIFLIQLHLTGQNVTSYKNGVVSSAHPEASKVGVDILKKGGNAVDAAVAVQFALAVVYPNAGNIGGGGFMVYRDKNGNASTLDYREKAPIKAKEDMYWGKDGKAITDLSLFGQMAAGVPGTVAGMTEAHKKFGKLPWKELIQPAIILAEKGFPITAMQANELNKNQDYFKKYNPKGCAFIKSTAWQKGDLLVQKELAETLKLIKDKGNAGFYEGKTAELIVKEMKSGNGIISLEDLKKYKAIWRKPIFGKYKGYKLIEMPPPSSGGISIIGILKGIEKYPLGKWGFQQDSTVRAIVEAERRVYADRSVYLGDPDFVKIPVKTLTDSLYQAKRMSNMSFDKATPSSAIKEGEINITEKLETTHYSIVDKEGNAVSITTTLNGSYGSKVVVNGAGFLLNNEMDDFSVKPGTPNMYGLVGGKANSIQPQKRMLSSMTPSILEKNGKLYMVVGSPGGSTIITSVLQTILNVVDFKMNMQDAVSAPRFHHQWLPDEILAEDAAIQPDVRKKLESSGYKFTSRAQIGRVDAVLVNPDGTLQGGADPRGDDSAQGY